MLLSEREGTQKRENMRNKLNCKVEPLQKKWLSMSEAMSYLGCSRDFLDNLKDKAELIPSKVSGKIFYKVTDIDKLLEKSRII